MKRKGNIHHKKTVPEQLLSKLPLSSVPDFKAEENLQPESFFYNVNQSYDSEA